MYLLDFYPRLEFWEMNTLFSAWSSGKRIYIVVPSVLMVVGSDVALLWVLNPPGTLFLKIASLK
jgi:hypothetical protein